MKKPLIARFGGAFSEYDINISKQIQGYLIVTKKGGYSSELISEDTDQFIFKDSIKNIEQIKQSIKGADAVPSVPQVDLAGRVDLADIDSMAPASLEIASNEIAELELNIEIKTKNVENSENLNTAGSEAENSENSENLENSAPAFEITEAEDLSILENLNPAGCEVKNSENSENSKAAKKLENTPLTNSKTAKEELLYELDKPGFEIEEKGFEIIEKKPKKAILEIQEPSGPGFEIIDESPENSENSENSKPVIQRQSSFEANDDDFIAAVLESLPKIDPIVENQSTKSNLDFAQRSQQMPAQQQQMPPQMPQSQAQRAQNLPKNQTEFSKAQSKEAENSSLENSKQISNQYFAKNIILPDSKILEIELFIGGYDELCDRFYFSHIPDDCEYKYSIKKGELRALFIADLSQSEAREFIGGFGFETSRATPKRIEIYINEGLAPSFITTLFG